MTEISLCMIVKDEEAHLEGCLESVQGAVDEIIVLDTGSTDRTKEIAGRFTDRVYDYVWRMILRRRATRPLPMRASRLFSGWMPTTGLSAASGRSLSRSREGLTNMWTR